MVSRSRYASWTRMVLVFTLAVSMLGAYTRLTDAGLSCPDWPACYGQWVLPSHPQALANAQALFPHTPIEPVKAWTEMTHRYLAGLLGFFISILAIAAIYQRRDDTRHPIFVPLLLFALVVFQALLGMWTVTLNVLPVIVTAHLMGGMAIAALLSWLAIQANPPTLDLHGPQKHLYPLIVFGLLIVIVQIFLGAWTSTHYAALACPNFPTCQGELFPALNWRDAFHFTAPIGPDYQGGHLSMSARMTIHMSHRYGAFLTVAFWLPFVLYLITHQRTRALRPYAWLILALLIIQCVLGILNVVALLPVLVAVGHSGVAILLLVTIVALLGNVYQAKRSHF